MVEERQYRKITLCGSTKFKDEYNWWNIKLTLEGNLVYSVASMTHTDKNPITDEQKELLDWVHKRKIDESDEIFVIDVDGYIGDSTHGEIEYALGKGKKVTLMSEVPIHKIELTNDDIEEIIHSMDSYIHNRLTDQKDIDKATTIIGKLELMWNK